MMQSLLNVIFGCAHRRKTFPITPGRRSIPSVANAAGRHGTYVVCLDCGKEFGYDWSEMRVGDPVGTRVPATATQTTYFPVNR